MPRPLHPKILVSLLAAGALVVVSVLAGIHDGRERAKGFASGLDAVNTSLARDLARPCSLRSEACLFQEFHKTAPAVGVFGLRLWTWREAGPRMVADRPLDGPTPAVPPRDGFWSGRGDTGPCHEGEDHHRCVAILSTQGDFLGVLELSAPAKSLSPLLVSVVTPLAGAILLVSGVLLVFAAGASLRAFLLLVLLTVASGGIRSLALLDIRDREVHSERILQEFVASLAPVGQTGVADPSSSLGSLAVQSARGFRLHRPPWIEFGHVLAWIGLTVLMGWRRREEVQDDLLHQREAQKELIRLRSVFASTRAVWWEWSPEAGKAEHDPRMALLLGYPTNALDLADPNLWRKLCHPEDRAATSAAIQRHIQGADARIQHDLRLQHGDGTWGWYTLSGSVIDRTSDGSRALRLSGILEDASVRRKMEEEIQALDLQSADNFRRMEVGNQALDAYAIVALTDAKGVIRSANQNFCAISGYSQEELVGRTHRMVNSGHHPAEFFRQMWECIRAGRTWRGHICNRAKDGRLYWVDTMILPRLDKDGKVVEYLAVRKEIAPPSSPDPRPAVLSSPPPPPEARRPSPLIDLDGLNRRMLGNRDLRDRVIGLFLEKTPALMSSLEEAIQSGSGEACILLHSIKGSSLNLGAAETAELAQRTEDLCQAGRIEEARPLFAELQVLVSRTCEEAESIRGS